MRSSSPQVRKKGEECPSMKNFVTEQITECILSCREMENTTSLYDQQTKACQCVADDCLAEGGESKNNSSATTYLFKVVRLTKR